MADTKKQVMQEIMQKFEDLEGIDELVIIAKRGDCSYHWEHSDLVSTFWWMGMLHHISDTLSSFQMGD